MLPSSSYSGVFFRRGARGSPAVADFVPFAGPGFFRSRPVLVSRGGGRGGGPGLAATSATSACANSAVVWGRLGPATGVSGSDSAAGSSASEGSGNDDPIIGGIPAGSDGARPDATVGGRLEVETGGVGVGVRAGVGLFVGADALGGGRGAVRAGRGALRCGDALTRGRGVLEASGEGEG